MVWKVTHRPVGSGAAWRRSLHQKSAGREREREKEEKEREEKEKREEKKKRKGQKSRRERCVVGVLHPQHIFCKRHGKGKRLGGKRCKRRQKWPEKIQWQKTDWDVRIGSIFHSRIKQFLAGQFYSTCRKRGYRLNRDPFFGILPKSLHQIMQIKFENYKVFIASEGAHPPQTPPFQTRKICKLLLIMIIFCMFQSITQEMMGLLKF